MKSNTKLISMIVALVVGVVGVIPVLTFAGAEDAELAGPVETSVMITLGVLIVAAVLALAAAAGNMVVNPAGLRNALIGIGTLAVVVIVAFAMADGSNHEMFDTDEDTAYYVSAGLNAFYIIGLLTLVSVLYSAVARIIK